MKEQIKNLTQNLPSNRAIQSAFKHHWRKIAVVAIILVIVIQVMFVDILRSSGDGSDGSSDVVGSDHRSGGDRLAAIVRKTHDTSLDIAGANAVVGSGGGAGADDDPEAPPPRSSSFKLPFFDALALRNEAEALEQQKRQQREREEQRRKQHQLTLDDDPTITVLETPEERINRVFRETCILNQTAEVYCGYHEMQVPAQSGGGSSKPRGKRGRLPPPPRRRSNADQMTTTTTAAAASAMNNRDEANAQSTSSIRTTAATAEKDALAKARETETLHFVCPGANAPGDFAHCPPEHELFGQITTESADTEEQQRRNHNKKQQHARPTTSTTTTQEPAATTTPAANNSTDDFAARHLENVLHLDEDAARRQRLAASGTITVTLPVLQQRSIGMGGQWESKVRAGNVSLMPKPYGACRIIALRELGADGRPASPTPSPEEDYNYLLPQETPAPPVGPASRAVRATQIPPDRVARIKFTFQRFAGAANPSSLHQQHPHHRHGGGGGGILSLGPFGCRPPTSVIVDWTPAAKSTIHGRNHIVIRLDGAPRAKSLEEQLQEIRNEKPTTTTTTPAPSTTIPISSPLSAGNSTTHAPLLPPRRYSNAALRANSLITKEAGTCRVSVQAFSVTQATRFCVDPSSFRPFFPPTVAPAQPGSRAALDTLTYSIEAAGLSSLDLFTASAEVCPGNSRHCPGSRFPEDADFVKLVQERARKEDLVNKLTTTTSTTTTTTTTRPPTTTTTSTTSTMATTTLVSAAASTTVAAAADGSNKINGDGDDEKKRDEEKDDNKLDEFAAESTSNGEAELSMRHQREAKRRQQQRDQQQHDEIHSAIQRVLNRQQNSNNKVQRLHHGGTNHNASAAAAAPPQMTPIQKQPLTPEAALLARSAALRCDGGMYMGYTNVVQSFVVCALLTSLCGRPVMEFPARLHHATLGDVFDIAAVNRKLQRKLGISLRLVGPRALADGVSTDGLLHNTATPTHPRMVGEFQHMCRLRPWATVFVGDLWPTRLNIAAADFHTQFASSVLVPSRNILRFSETIISHMNNAGGGGDSNNPESLLQQHDAQLHPTWVAVHLRFEDDAVKLGGNKQNSAVEARARRLRTFVDAHFGDARVYYASGRLHPNISAQFPLLGKKIRQQLIEHRRKMLLLRIEEKHRKHRRHNGNNNHHHAQQQQQRNSAWSAWADWWQSKTSHGYYDEDEAAAEVRMNARAGADIDHHNNNVHLEQEPAWVNKNDFFPANQRPWHRTFTGRYFNGRPVNITNATGSAIDMHVLVSAPVAVVAEFSSFGEVVAAVRCARGMKVYMYDVEASVFPVDCDESVLFRRSLHEQIRAAEQAMRAQFLDARSDLTRMVHNTVRQRNPKVAPKKLREIGYHFYQQQQQHGGEGDENAAEASSSSGNHRQRNHHDHDDDDD